MPAELNKVMEIMIAIITMIKLTMMKNIMIIYKSRNNNNKIKN